MNIAHLHHSCSIWLTASSATVVRVLLAAAHPNCWGFEHMQPSRMMRGHQSKHTGSMLVVCTEEVTNKVQMQHKQE